MGARDERCGTILDGRYRLDERVGEGGFGVVYRAWHTRLDAPVAVKVLAAPLASPQARAGFDAEVRTLAGLRHPGIVAVLDAGLTDDAGGPRPWFAMQWCDGGTLREDLDARRGRGGRPIAEVFALVRPALEALAYAHAAGVVHRDIKPSNLVCSPSPLGTTLRVVDFGVAKVAGDAPANGGDTETHSTPAPYTAAYAAPEQLARTGTSARTDVHAMALVITELLTDRAPYDASGLDAFGARRPTPAAFGVDAGAWEPVLARALALDAADRYADAAELLRALEPAATASPRADTTAAERGAVISIASAAPARPSRVGRRVFFGIAAGAAVAAAGAAVFFSTRPPPAKPPKLAELRREEVERRIKRTSFQPIAPPAFTEAGATRTQTYIVRDGRTVLTATLYVFPNDLTTLRHSLNAWLAADADITYALQDEALFVLAGGDLAAMRTFAAAIVEGTGATLVERPRGARAP